VSPTTPLDFTDETEAQEVTEFGLPKTQFTNSNSICLAQNYGLSLKEKYPE
jgi:hypothetical protein